MDKLDNVIKQILVVCNLEDVGIIRYYNKVALSFKKNIIYNFSTVCRDGNLINVHIQLYCSYGEPVCARVDTITSHKIIWWNFRESSTTYRGLYEFLNRTHTIDGKLNRSTIKEFKRAPNALFL